MVAHWGPLHSHRFVRRPGARAARSRRPLFSHPRSRAIAAHRIVSLLPSTTEIACALGFRDQLVGRSHECDYPGGVAALPICTSPRLEDGTSREIDDRVKDLVRRGISIYDLDADLLRRLAPTAILTQDQCEVCAVTLGEVESALAAWLGSRPTLVSLRSSSLADVWDDVRRVGAALGAELRGLDLARALEEQTREIGERASEARKARKANERGRPRVACIEWIDPPMSAGNWMPELVTLAGGQPLFCEPGEHSAWLRWDELRRSDPDVIVVTPCGFDLLRTRAEMATLVSLPGWESLSAVRDKRVFLTDGNAFFNRPGPRLVESLQILAEILHPERFSFGHEGKGWQRFSS